MNELIKILSYGISIEKSPFKKIAHQLKMSEDEIIERIKELKNEGIIRFFRGSIDYRKIGYKENLMACFLVKDELIDDIAKKIAKYKIVSHCYKRLPAKNFKYNLFLMLHGKTKDEVLECVEGIKRDFGLKDSLVLWTKREFKRQRPRFKEVKDGD